MTSVCEAPSQPAGFTVSQPSPDYPFQMIVADYFSLHGHNFLVIADRFTGWNAIVSTPQRKFDGQHLVTIMRDFCATWNIPEHINTDGGPQMMRGVLKIWTKDWDITHRPSSAYFPHSNSRAETAVKSSKRMLQDRVSRAGNIDNDKFVKAILQYRNTPHNDCRISPAQMVFGRTLRDHIPCLPYKYAASANWCVSQELKKMMMTKSREVDGEKSARNTRSLQSLPMGTPAAIQNQSGRYPTKWDKTGVIMEVRPQEQIVVKVDGSRRLTLRNRRFVHELDPRKTSLEDLRPTTSTTQQQMPRQGRMRRSAGHDSCTDRRQ